MAELRKGFVILDDRQTPWMFHNGWWHYWHPDNKWVTHHEAVFDLIPERCILTKEQAAAYGIDQQPIPGAREGVVGLTAEQPQQEGSSDA